MRSNECIFVWPVEWMMNVILDALELQKATIVFDDASAGVLHYTTEMYGVAREFRLTITPAARNRSRVRIEVRSTKSGSEPYHLQMQFALLSSLMANYEDSG